MPRSLWGSVSLRVAVLVLLVAPGAVRAQGDLEGPVIAIGDRTPVAGAQVRLPGPGRTATSDTAGRFVFSGLPSGTQLVVIRAPGFRPDSVKVMIPAEQILVQDFVLARAVTTTLGEVKVTGVAAKPKMSGFEDRRRQGTGRFFDREMLGKVENSNMSMILSTAPGVRVWQGGSKAFLSSTRAYNTDVCAFCKSKPDSLLDVYDQAAGARPACYMDVYVDGTIVYQYGAQPPMRLFDINSIPAEQLEGVELYASAAQVPAQYNRTATGCGVVLLWTRVSK